jgi:hypothetical protein
MKYSNLIFIISLLIACSLQEELTQTFPSNYFEGNWLMTGYGCNRHTPKVETMVAHMEGDVVIATKTLGDDCVTTGTETFRGKLPATLQTGKNMKITYVVGNARKPNSGHWNNSMHIINENEFRSQKRVYTRDSAKNLAEHPVVVPAVVPAVIPAPVSTPTTEVHVVEPVPAPVAPVSPTTPVTRFVYYYHNYFLGNWNGVGYTCDATTPKIEVVNIKYSNGNLYAIKLLGDVCVPANKLTFDGAIPAKLWQGIDFPVNFVIGSPEHPSARQVLNSIHIVDLNTFKIGTHTYYRVMGPGNAQPNGVYINMTPLVGHSSYPGPGYVKLNPKKNMRSPVRRFVIVEEETNKPGNC